MPPLKTACVLVSGGVDSALLLQHALTQKREVHPLYVACGFVWENAEKDSLNRFLEYLKNPLQKKLITLDAPLQPILPDHWGFFPEKVPSKNSPPPAVFLPGRNIHLLSQASLLAYQKKLAEIWIGTLKGNSFSDAKWPFFHTFEELFALAFGRKIKIQAPFYELSKKELLKNHPDFPYRLTLTCLNPQGDRHCGDCNKCEERRRAFREAALPDPTVYLKNETES